MKPNRQRTMGKPALGEGAAVLVALGFDLLGEPPAAWHPVVWSGKLIWRLERAAPQGHVPQLLYGLAMLALAAPAATLPAATAHRLAKRVQLEGIQRGHAYGGLILYAVVEGGGRKPCFSLRSLVEGGRSVRVAPAQRE